MDILNWLYLRKQQLIRTEANNASTDIVALGAEVPFTTRGDGYQTYAMTLADAVHAGCVENNTLKTGIFDEYPWVITPVMLPTCTRVEDTPAFPTMFQGNLVGYKVSGSYDLNEGNNTVVVEYIGTVESTDGSSLFNFPWTTSGTVSVSAGTPFPSSINLFSNAFANGAFVVDDNGDLAATEFMTIAGDVFAPDGIDLYLVVSSATAVDAIYAEISFEYEFLQIEGQPIKFTRY